MRYIFLDDKPEDVLSHASNLKDEPNFYVDVESPDKLDLAIKDLIAKKPDGLILDFRLDQTEKSNYRAPSIAQEYRLRSTEDINIDIPIVLCSTGSAKEFPHINDSTWQDLFDANYSKDEVWQDTGRVRTELISLVNGYKAIRETVDNFRDEDFMLKLLKLEQEKSTFIDSRFLTHFYLINTGSDKSSTEGRLPIHEYARFILNEVIHRPGPLVDKNLLAARLGVELSSPGLPTLVNDILGPAKYTGPFYEGWERWWWNIIELWWQEKISSETILSDLNSSQRVELISGVTGINDLTAIAVQEHSHSTLFWAVCKNTGVPLDPSEGFLILSGRDFSWQESEYINKKSAMDATYKIKGIRINPVERYKLEALLEEE